MTTPTQTGDKPKPMTSADYAEAGVPSPHCIACGGLPPCRCDLNEARPETVYWIGTEDQQHIARMEACRARRKQWGEDDCDMKDGSCAECEMDMAHTLRVTKEQWEAEGFRDV